eukprot:TRINITY_DN73936_c0_g1_i1.p1 TRINITY_DN73936_c0_g1~~TRINITY_DN73936_c0_g1_i1.p1  ORF type:complete len:435 (-),score=51.91 TRINITY_DN73936_c0_g1_i1:56-1282(-)
MLPARAVVRGPGQLALVLSAICAWATIRAPLLFCSSPWQPSSRTTVSPTATGQPLLPAQASMLQRETNLHFGAALLGASSLIVAMAAGLKSRKTNFTRTVSCTTRAIPMEHTIPVVDLENNHVGDETMQFRTFSRDTANYAVHHAHMIWTYQQIQHTEFHPRLGDRDQGVRKGKKMWPNKGVGRARMGSLWGTLFGKTATNKAKHGMDNKRRKKLMRDKHSIAISTVLQSKWRNMIIVDGLEDWPEARYYEMKKFITNVTGIPAGRKHTLLIARNCYGKEHGFQCVPTWNSYKSPIYMSGRLIEKFQMRRPREIDPVSDALHQCLKARRIIISREAFYDLKAKYGAHNGWIFQAPIKIMVKQLQQLVKDYPYDRVEAYESTRALPFEIEDREFWAKARRDEEAQAALD